MEPNRLGEANSFSRQMYDANPQSQVAVDSVDPLKSSISAVQNCILVEHVKNRAQGE